MNPEVERILKTAKDRGLNQKQLAQKLGIHPQVITAWKGGSTSYTDYVAHIAEILETTTDYLHTGKEPQAVPLPEDQLDAALVAELTTATPEEITQVRAFLQGLKAGRRGPASPDK